MATDTLENKQAPNNGVDLASILKLFIPSQGDQTTKTSGGTQTTQTGLDQKTIEGLINQLLGSNQGLASVVSGQNTSGMYNSTVNTQLVNDLMSKVTTDVAAKAAPSVVTTSPLTKTASTAAQVDPIMGLLGTAGAYVGNRILKKSGIQDAIDGASDKLGGAISSALGLGDSSTVAGAGVGNAVSDSLSSAGSNLFGVGGSNAVSSFADSISSFGGLGDAVGGVMNNFLGSAGGNVIGDATGIMGLDGAMGLGTNSVPVLGPVMDFANGNPAGGIGTIIGSMTPLGPVGGVIGGLVGDLVGGDSVICTELHRQGLLASDVYALDSIYGKTKVSARVMTGYHSFGIPIAQAMAKSSFITSLVKPFATAWANEMAHKMQPHAYAPDLLGKLIFAIGVPACAAIGYAISLKKGAMSWVPSTN